MAIVVPCLEMELKHAGFRIITSTVKKRNCNDIDIEVTCRSRRYSLTVPVKHWPFTNFFGIGQKALSCLWNLINNKPRLILWNSQGKRITALLTLPDLEEEKFFSPEKVTIKSIRRIQNYFSYFDVMNILKYLLVNNTQENPRPIISEYGLRTKETRSAVFIRFRLTSIC